MVPFKFIPPAVPVLRATPPAGEGWLHEVKFDGWRAQLHKVGHESVVLPKSGHDISARCRPVVKEASEISARSVIVDGELVVLDAEGRPDFAAIGRRGAAATLWAFDLLELNGSDLRTKPLLERRRRLQGLLPKALEHIRFSESFADPVALLTVLESMTIEGIVSKRGEAP